MSVTADAYLQVLRQLDSGLLAHVKSVILISPTLGSNSLVHTYIKEKGAEAESRNISLFVHPVYPVRLPADRSVLSA